MIIWLKKLVCVILASSSNVSKDYVEKMLVTLRESSQGIGPVVACSTAGREVRGLNPTFA